MEVERWGEDEEVSMDVDLTAEEELKLLSVISQNRSTVTLDPCTPSIMKEASACQNLHFTVSEGVSFPGQNTCLLLAGNVVSCAGYKCIDFSPSLPGGAEGLCHQGCWEASADSPMDSHAGIGCPQVSVC